MADCIVISYENAVTYSGGAGEMTYTRVTASKKGAMEHDLRRFQRRFPGKSDFG